MRRGHLVTEKIPPSAFIALMNAMCPGGLTAAEAGKRIEGSLAGVNTLWQSFVQLAEKKKLQQHSEEVMKEIFWKWRFDLVRVQFQNFVNQHNTTHELPSVSTVYVHNLTYESFRITPKSRQSQRFLVFQHCSLSALLQALWKRVYYLFTVVLLLLLLGIIYCP